MKINNIKNKLNSFKNVSIELDNVMFNKEYKVENDFILFVLNGKKQIKDIQIKKMITSSNLVLFKDELIRLLNENNTQINLDVQDEMSKLMKLK